MAGAPTHWRQSNGDSKPGFEPFYKAVDVLSPWLVGRFPDVKGFDKYMSSSFIDDAAAAKKDHVEYAPVVFPGFRCAAALCVCCADALLVCAACCGCCYVLLCPAADAVCLPPFSWANLQRTTGLCHGSSCKYNQIKRLNGTFWRHQVTKLTQGCLLRIPKIYR